MIDLKERALELTQPPKGILAADESNASADARLSLCGIESSPEVRRQYRELFLDAPGIEQYLTGVILYTETLEQKDVNGVPFTKLLLDRGILPGIKVDEGTEPMPESPTELITKGLLGLSARLTEYRDKHNAAFTKWRAVITIEGDRLPTSAAIVENAKRLAMYARCVQEAGMVPILEPEVLYDGTHSRMRSRAVITETLHAVMQALDEHGVDPSGIIIKTSMALSGKDTGRMDTPEEVAEDTLGALLEAVPPGVPGIVFLSGGQGDDQAIQNLAAIHERAKEKGAPWNLTFSYARAIQNEALKTWKCEPQNVPHARVAYLAELEKLRNALA